jgi:hypothetical protein
MSGWATNTPMCTRQCKTSSWVSNHLWCLTLAPLHGIFGLCLLARVVQINDVLIVVSFCLHVCSFLGLCYEYKLDGTILPLIETFLVRWRLPKVTSCSTNTFSRWWASKLGSNAWQKIKGLEWLSWKPSLTTLLNNYMAWLWGLVRGRQGICCEDDKWHQEGCGLRCPQQLGEDVQEDYRSY